MENKIRKIFSEKRNGEVSNELLKKDISSKNYLICFTPRSGSSWLTRLLRATNKLGNPDEWFNPESLVGNIEKYNCSNIYEYIDVIRRDKSSSNGIFGVEMSYYHCYFLFEIISIEQVFGQVPIIFYLTRQNIILQGISLYLSVESGYFHSYQKDATAIEKFNSVEYSAPKIKKWCNHIIDQEIGFKNLLNSLNIEPIRLNYESIGANPNEIVKLFCNVLNVRYPESLEEKDTLIKIGTQRNIDWGNRFVNDFPDFVDELNARRY